MGDPPTDPRSARAGPSNRFRFAKRALIASLIAVAVIAAVGLLGYAVHVLLAIFAGVLVAVFLGRLTGYVSRFTHLSHGWALAIVVLVLLAVLSGMGWFLGAQIADQVDKLAETLPDAIERLRQRIEQNPWGRTVLRYVNQLEPQSAIDGRTIRQATGYASATVGAIVNVFVIAFLGLYLSYQPGLYVRGIVRLVPHRGQPRAEQVMRVLGDTLWHWLLGRFLAMAIVWGLTSLGLWLLGMPLALTLGLLAGLLNFIPNIGPIISAIPAALLALTQGPSQALYVVLLYVGVQFLESYLITPQVERHMVSIPPALLIGSQVLLGVLLGFMGLLLATPLIAIAMVLVKMLYVEDVLGEPAMQEQ